MSAAATDLASIGSSIAAASQGAAGATTGVLAAAQDEVSAAIAAFWSVHGQGYQALSAQAAAFQERFAQALTGAAGQYVAAEASNASLSEAFVFTRVTNALLTGISGAPAAAPFAAAQVGIFADIQSLANSLEAAMWPVKSLLALSGFETPLAAANNALWRLLEVPPLAWYIGNGPTPYLTWPLGLSVQYGAYDGMSVVQITPPHPSGEYVVAIHGGGFILPPSIFHWIHYSAMSYQTGATMEVPIYPLVWQGGTAGTVVPTMAGLISSLVTQHGAANVSVTGDSAGGNLALASVQYMVSQGDPVPSRMVLLSPWLDIGSPWRDVWSMQLANMWAGNLAVNNYLVSPLYGSLAGLPPTYVYSGSWDPLAAQASVLQQAALAQGAPLSFVLDNFQVHDWVLFTPWGSLYWPQINQELGIAA
ncbi:triacylglycerol lipase LipY [Mycobacterium camsae]|uniref:triacylglycerol lipase LipY n=1 Tax=Mycobacterium gordonae TaxID=1778 RepID=UPI001F11F4CD|nr:PE domain-containing protein [Mycobacterium gordonae]